MTPVAMALGGAALLGAGYLFYKQSKAPHNDHPAGNGDVTPIPPAPTPQNPHPTTAVQVLSLPGLEARSGVKDLVDYAGTPLRNLHNGDFTMVAMSWEGIRANHGLWPVPMTIVDEDPEAARGYAVAKIGDNFAIPGGPSAGTKLSLSTATDDDVANLDPASAGFTDFLMSQGID